jgi:hypothetical protein
MTVAARVRQATDCVGVRNLNPRPSVCARCRRAARSDVGHKRTWRQRSFGVRLAPEIGHCYRVRLASVLCQQQKWLSHGVTSDGRHVSRVCRQQAHVIMPCESGLQWPNGRQGRLEPPDGAFARRDDWVKQKAPAWPEGGNRRQNEGHFAGTSLPSNLYRV